MGKYLGLIKKILGLSIFFKKKNKSHTSNIFISKLAYVCPSAKLDIVHGGQISIGENTEILSGVILMTYGGKISIGKNCSINPYTILYGHGDLVIGDNVLIAGQCMLIPANHRFERLDIPINQQGVSSKGIIIEDDVWIAGGCQILDGVVIGKGSIVAAGSVVTKSIEPYSIVAGIPAVVKKMRRNL